jgi:hypothetical protein
MINQCTPYNPYLNQLNCTWYSCERPSLKAQTVDASGRGSLYSSIPGDNLRAIMAIIRHDKA